MFDFDLMPKTKQTVDLSETETKQNKKDNFKVVELLQKQSARMVPIPFIYSNMPFGIIN